jgi:hypothetical protein
MCHEVPPNCFMWISVVSDAVTKCCVFMQWTFKCVLCQLYSAIVTAQWNGKP